MADNMERFTQRARRVLSLAHEEAERLHHNYIGTEHLLLGLIREEGGVAGRVLRELGLEPARVKEIVERLCDVFEYVSSDAGVGAEQVGDMIAHLRRMKAGLKKRKELPPMAAEIDKQIARLEATRAEAVNIVVIADPLDEDASFSFTALPGDDLMIGYANAQHEATATPLVERAAEALGYTMKLI